MFYRAATAAILQERFPLPDGIRDHRGPEHEHRMRWLARWGMGEQAISRLFGRPVGEVRGVVTRPMLVGHERALVRVVPADDLANSWRVDGWSPSGWEPIEMTVAEVVLEGVPAPRAALRSAGALYEMTSTLTSRSHR